MIDNREELGGTPAREIVLESLCAGILAADPASAVTEAVELAGESLRIDGMQYDLREYDRLVVLGGGKAAGRMAMALESILDDRIDDGIVVTTSPVGCSRVRDVEGEHPIPSARNVAATTDLLELARSAGATTLVIAVISGGGSALLTAPAEGLALDDVQAVTRELLTEGAEIESINAVRKHLSAIKGGRLAEAAAPATVHGLILSDVVGDDLGVIASGPTAPDPTTYADATAVLTRYGIEPPAAVEAHLASGDRTARRETPGPADDLFETVTNTIVAGATESVTAAADEARDRGLDARILATGITGESREVGRTLGAIAEEVRRRGRPIEPPAALISAGETTVTVTGEGRGGPNQECALAAATELPAGVAFGALDTDGIDGTGPAAGAIVDASTVDDVGEATAALERNDAYGFLQASGDAIITGATGTNVNDLRIAVIADGDEVDA